MDKGKFLGILTPLDIIESPHVLVIDCLHDKPRADMDQDLDSVLAMMKESRESVIPVFHADEFIGVVTQADITEYMLEYHNELNQTISERTAELAKANSELENTIKKLQDALEKVKTLRGLLPICSNCKKIRDDKGYWENIDSYIETHSDILFTHGLCKACADKLYGHKDWYIKKNPPS